jgi:hypothetical protein
MQSIDIHALIDKDFYANKAKQASSSTSDSVSRSVPNTFLSLLSTQYKALLISNGEPNDEKMLYCLRFSRSHVYFIQSKLKKLKVSHYDFTQNFLTINKRKGSLDDFKNLQNTLIKLAEILSRKKTYVLAKCIETTTEQTLSTEQNAVLDLFKQKLSIKESALQFIHSISKEYYDKLSNTIKKFSTLLIQKTVPQAQATSKFDLGCFQKLADDLLSPLHKKIVIANLSTTNSSNSYCLEVTKETLLLTEKNPLNQNKINVSLKDNSITINGKLSNSDNKNWILNKLRTIGNDCKQQRASVYFSDI